MSRDPRRNGANGPSSGAPGGAAAAAALFQAAVRDFTAGRLAEAERACRRILAEFPGNAPAQHLLGLVAFRAGHLADAQSLIERALAQQPNDADMRNSLGCVLVERQEPAAALAAFDAALKSRPAYPDAHANRARVLLALGRAAEAVESSRKALALRPDFFDAWTHLGNGLLALDRLPEAADAFGRAAALRPGHAGAHNNLGRVASERGRLSQAEAEFRRAVELAPRDPTGYANLGVTLNRLRLPEEAEVVLRQARPLAPTDSRLLAGIGEAQLLQGRIDAGLETYQALVAEHPDDAQAQVDLGSALMTAGHRDRAIEAFNAALRLDSASPTALANLIDLQEPAPGDPLFERVEALLAGGTVDEAGESLLRFALGRVLLKVKDGDRAFAHLNRANALKRARIDFSIDESERFLTSIAARFTPELMARLAGGGARSERPIFVVGMPRSGTTLVEQILASHPDVWGGDELGILGSLARTLPAPGYPDALGDADAAAIGSLGRGYLAQTDTLAQGRARLVDKLPVNFVFAGLIALALPDARIIACRRDPVDTCLSCYSIQFGNVPYSYDLAELGRYWRAHDALMNHWRTILPPERLIEVQYEDVVADIDTQARRMIAFAGLPWDEACLAFHKTARAVRTSSVNQVRQPIYGRSVGRWVPFARHLRPLLAALGVADPSLGGW